jgi:hypothetical protein
MTVADVVRERYQHVPLIVVGRELCQERQRCKECSDQGNEDRERLPPARDGKSRSGWIYCNVTLLEILIAPVHYLQR